MTRVGRSHRVGDVIEARRVVVVRKSTAIERHAAREDPGFSRVLADGGDIAARLQQAHDQHRSSCAIVINALRDYGFDVRVVAGLRRRDARESDLIVTIGGDGTFLRASHCVESPTADSALGGEAAGLDGPVKHADAVAAALALPDHGTPMLGVNSSPETSIGFFCAATAATIEAWLNRLRRGEIQTSPLWRMAVSIDGRRVDDLALNDVLVAHRVPAETTRYTLSVDGASQRQKSSGVWIATAAGSTGAIRSAGGDIQDLDDRRVQFRVRELFPMSIGEDVPLLGGCTSGAVELVSHTPSGVLYLDGAHRKIRFGMGDHLCFWIDAVPLPWVAPLETEARREEVVRRSSRILSAAVPLLP
jgi:NAD+ kinase